MVAVLWAALAGVFGMEFLGGEREAVSFGTEKMKGAVGVDLVVMILWLLSAGVGLVRCVRERKERRDYRKGLKEEARMLEGQEEGQMIQVQDEDMSDVMEKGVFDGDLKQEKGKY